MKFSVLHTIVHMVHFKLIFTYGKNHLNLLQTLVVSFMGSFSHMFYAK